MVAGVRGFTHHPDIADFMGFRPTSHAFYALDSSRFVYRFVFMAQINFHILMKTYHQNPGADQRLQLIFTIVDFS
jgi:hypothetical protein